MIERIPGKLGRHLSKVRIQQIAIVFVGIMVVGGVSTIGSLVQKDSRAAAVGTMYVTPASGTYSPGATISVAIREEGGTNAINSVQASLNYNASQLQFMSVSDSTAFPFVAATDTATPGVVRLARGVNFGAAGITGDQHVATVHFKVLAVTGTTSLSFNNAASLIVRASDQTNIMTGSSGATYTLAQSNNSAILYAAPRSGDIVPGSTFTVEVRENSVADAINTVQASVKYNAAQLQLLGITEGTTFPLVLATDTSTAGLIRLARGVSVGTPGIVGDQLVVKLNFKLLTSTDTTTISFDNASSMLVRSSDSTNVMTGSTEATYTIKYPAPTIAAVSPSSGPSTGGTTLTITGTNFLSGATVKVGTTAATSVSYVSSTTLLAVTPSHSTGGLKDIVVTNPDGQTVTKTGAFTYTVNLVPVITGLSPSTGYDVGGAGVTINGSNFMSGATVKFGNTAATSVLVVNSATITVVAPPHAAGSVSVTVTNPNGQTVTLANGYTYRLAGDANGDSRVNGLDYSILAEHDGQNYPASDFNGDGTVGAADLAILLARWTW